MIVLNNVCLSYGSKKVIKNFSQVFEDNKIYAMTGPSGCGKSTILRMMCGLLKPTSGTVTYGDGQIVKRASNEVFMMHQHYTNFPWMDCLSNVLLPVKLKAKITEENKQEAMRLLEKVGLGSSAKLYPHELSGGMKQRVALARTLIIKPKVLLMDEPLSALDPKTRVEMQDLILNLHKETGNTIVMITHDENEAERMADYRIKFNKEG